MIFPNILPPTHRIVEVSPIFCAITDGMIGTRFRETGITYKSQTLARKIADRMTGEAYENCFDCFYTAIPIDAAASYLPPAPKFYAPDAETSDALPF